jgi:hypothetical protein
MENLLSAGRANVDLALTVDRLLDQLAATKPEWSTLVELEYFLACLTERRPTPWWA